MALNRLQKIDILKSLFFFLMEGLHYLHDEWCVIKNKSSISVLWLCIQR